MIEDRYMKPEKAPWLDDSSNEYLTREQIAADRSKALGYDFSEDRGPLERKGKIVSVNVGVWAQRLSRWFGWSRA